MTILQECPGDCESISLPSICEIKRISLYSSKMALVRRYVTAMQLVQWPRCQDLGKAADLICRNLALDSSRIIASIVKSKDVS